MTEKSRTRTIERHDPFPIAQMLVDSVNWLNSQRERSIDQLSPTLSEDQMLGLKKIPDNFQEKDFLALGVIRMLTNLDPYSVHQSIATEPLSKALQRNVVSLMNSAETMDLRKSSSCLSMMVSELSSREDASVESTKRSVVASSLVKAQTALLQFIRNDKKALQHFQELVDFQNEYSLLPDQLRVFIQRFQLQYPGLIKLKTPSRGEPSALIGKIGEVLSSD